LIENLIKSLKMILKGKINWVTNSLHPPEQALEWLDG
jgi:hypothetical protein